MDLISRLILPQNLDYAWAKAKRLHHMADGHRDLTEFAQFELDLESRLGEIRERFNAGDYSLKNLKPLPRPKKIENGSPINRQYFHVALEDQVAWIAVANVLGPLLDKEMPPWSYGNRIYRPAWYEQEEAHDLRLEIGPYRHANGQLYRKFQHSWPLFRRHVALTCKIMSRAEHAEQDDDHLPDVADQVAELTAKADGLRYLDSDFWKPTKGEDRRFLHHASIDLKQFFPKIRRTAIVSTLYQELADEPEAGQFVSLLERMLDFKVEEPTSVETQICAQVEPPFEEFDGIPTGLFVSGFLSNVAMLPIDKIMDQKVAAKRNVAHFRFVDDHTIIAYDFNTLRDFIRDYERLIAKSGVGAEINWEKTDPPPLGQLLNPAPKEGETTPLIEDEIAEDTRIDGRNPTKLLTKTLTRISALATTGIDTLDDDDLKGRLDQLEWLLLADIPDREIRADTRAAFAAGQISNLAPFLNHMSTELVQVSRKLAQLKADPSMLQDEGSEELQLRLAETNLEFVSLWKGFEKDEMRQLRRCFNLLMQALREHPTKARLFFRLHHYCRLTGFPGLKNLSAWLNEFRKDDKNDSWHDYYVSLSLQLLGDGALKAARVLQSSSSMRSEIRAAKRFLQDIADNGAKFHISSARAENNWVYKLSAQEFCVSLLAVSQGFDGQSTEETKLFQALAEKANLYADLSFTQSSERWLEETNYSSGSWAFSIERRLSATSEPTKAWNAFEGSMNYRLEHDSLAARYYPQQLSDRGFEALLNGQFSLEPNDVGWVADCLKAPSREGVALGPNESSTAPLVAFAFRAVGRSEKNKVNLYEWVDFTFGGSIDPFDPRRGEWTCLEIIRQLVSEAEDWDMSPQMNLGLFSSPNPDDKLKGFHPANVWVPNPWLTQNPQTWEDWRNSVSGERNVTKSSLGESIQDFRYSSTDEISRHYFRSVGRVLLGLLTGSFEAPHIWNCRGNERMGGFPSAIELERLAVSSRTILIIEACLNRRSDENRLLRSQKNLFGLGPAESATDLKFDAPILVSPAELHREIVEAQSELEKLQLSITHQRPRQLIPFRTADFSAATRSSDEEN